MLARKLILRVNAVFLIVAGTGGLVTDLVAVYVGKGPQVSILAAAPHAAIGFVEAHGLAMILGVLLWRAQPARSWHFTAAAIHLLLGVSNLAFWQIFIAADMLAVGYITTVLHATFALLQLYCGSFAVPVGDALKRMPGGK